MITVENLSKLYGDRRAVDDISFGVRKGEILGFLGPNGAGKTTTMRMLTGFIPPSGGRAVVGGFDLSREGRAARRIIGYQPENPPLYGEMTVSEYLGFAARIQGVAPRSVSGRVTRVMERCGLADVRGRLLRNLSKGFRQRAAIAQALVHEPEVLIFDEPTIGLDPLQIIEIRNLIRGLAGDHTVILSSHILPEVTMTCQRVVIINQGKLVAEDTYEGLKSRVQKARRLFVRLARGEAAEVGAAFSGLEGVLRANEEADGEGTVHRVEYSLEHDVREELARVAVERGWGLLEMRSDDLSLEEVFLQLTTEEDLSDQ
jgi:ABC-2 type transport system ATP-binding protein